MENSRIAAILSAVFLAAGAVHAQNLLYNGNFNITNSTANGPDGWSSWMYTNPGNPGPNYAWTNWKADSLGETPTDSYVNAGNTGDWSGGGGGWYQVVTSGITVGATYTLSVDSATENWWNPLGEMRLFFQDGSGNTIDSTVLNVTQWTPSLPWSTYSLSAVAPANTAKIKVEFAEPGSGGTVMFDNALLIPEPSTFALVGLGLLAGFIRCRRQTRRDV